MSGNMITTTSLTRPPHGAQRITEQQFDTATGIAEPPTITYEYDPTNRRHLLAVIRDLRRRKRAR